MLSVLSSPLLLRDLSFSVSFANPKSRILAWLRLVMKMFAGFMSRWIMP